MPESADQRTVGPKATALDGWDDGGTTEAKNERQKVLRKKQIKRLKKPDRVFPCLFQSASNIVDNNASEGLR